MSAVACERAALVEAFFDERLGRSERASMDRHLAVCPSCDALLGELREVRKTLRSATTAISPLEHQRARLKLLRHAAVPTPRRRPVARLAVVMVMLSVAVCAAAGSLAGRRGRDIDEATVSPSHGAPTNEPPASPVVLPQHVMTPTDTSSSAPIPSISTPLPLSSAHMPSPPASGRSSISREFADAMDAVARGDFGAGATKLEHFASAHPEDPRAEEALYLEAIALERAGRTSEAKATAARYLTSYPDGAHRTQARRLAGD